MAKEDVQNGTCATVDTAGGLELLARQRDLYRTLRALAERQRVLITSSRSEELLTVLTERQKVVDQLTSLDPQVKALREQWQTVYWMMTGSQRKTADTLVREVQLLLSEILAGDEQDARLLSARITDNRRESLAMAESKRAHMAYGVATAGNRVATGDNDSMIDCTE